MKIKYYKTTEDDILRWWFSLKPTDCATQYNPLEIINDLKTGNKEWYHKGIPLKLKMYAGNSTDIVGTITLRNDNQQPFYKDDAGIHSGWLLTFQLTVSDDFDYCTPENIDLYAGNI